MSDSLQFHSKDIFSSLNEYSIWFDTHSQLIKQVSDDIKHLEQHLKNKNLALAFEMECFFNPKDQVSLDDHNHEYFIKWGRNPANKEFRLLYRQYREVYDPVTEEREFYSEEVKPLVEARTEIRFALHPFLPLFIKQFAEYLKGRATRLSESSLSEPVKT